MIKDNRIFIEKLEKTGDVVRVKQEVDWDLEAGAIIRRTNERRGPAPFFEKIRDYPAGYRIFGSPLGTHRRLALALGLMPDASIESLQNEYELRTDNPVKPAIVKKAPCKENILKGQDVNLFQFPAPMIHEGDGGRYIATWHAVIAKDPDSEWTNWGMYRLMAHNRRHTGVDWHKGNHGGQLYYGKYVPRGRAMPLAVAIGMDPLSSFMAASHLKRGQSEADFAGALHREPVELIKAETSDIMVPANAEIILEGEVLPDLRAAEGPHGEFPGYRNPIRNLPVFRVNAITYRNNPVLTMTCIGMPVEDSDICMQISAAVSIKRRLRQSGLPVKEVFLPPETASHLVIISLNSSSANIIKQVENLIYAHGLGEVKTIVVDSDVDVFNLNEVIHAFATKCHPQKGIRISEVNFTIELTPYLSLEERKGAKGYRSLFDCTWTEDWSKETDIPPRVSFKEVYPEEIKDKVIKNWKSYGFSS